MLPSSQLKMFNSVKSYLHSCITCNERETRITYILLTTKNLLSKIRYFSQNVIQIMGTILPCIFMWVHTQINVNNSTSLWYKPSTLIRLRRLSCSRTILTSSTEISVTEYYVQLLWSDLSPFLYIDTTPAPFHSWNHSSWQPVQCLKKFKSPLEQSAWGTNPLLLPINKLLYKMVYSMMCGGC
jgi:hypothetical protein